MRILFIEDDADIARTVTQGLAPFGHQVVAAADAASGLAHLAAGDFEALILDLMLPDRPGEEVLVEVRRGSKDLPVLVLSAKQRTEDKIACLNAGGDDYLTKPFAMAELAARIAAIDRRSRRADRTELASEGLRLDLVGRAVTVDGRKIALKDKEFALLQYFMEHPGQVLTRAMILHQIWGYDFVPESNVLDVHICLLREKIGGAGKKRFIHNVRGLGYVLRRDDALE